MFELLQKKLNYHQNNLFRLMLDGEFLFVLFALLNHEAAMNAFQRDLPDASVIGIRPHVGHWLATADRREKIVDIPTHMKQPHYLKIFAEAREEAAVKKGERRKYKEFLKSLDDEWNVHESSMEHRDYLDSSSSSSSDDEDGSDARAGADDCNSDANLGGGSEEEEYLDEP